MSLLIRLPYVTRFEGSPLEINEKIPNSFKLLFSRWTRTALSRTAKTAHKFYVVENLGNLLLRHVAVDGDCMLGPDVIEELYPHLAGWHTLTQTALFTFLDSQVNTSFGEFYGG